MVYQNGKWVYLISDHHFKEFFPVYSAKLHKLLDSTCHGNYTSYIGKNATCDDDWLQFGWRIGPADCSGYKLLNCILDALPETAKSDMQSAGTFLGLLPVLLSMVGSTTAEVGLLSLRRPLLASMLALASPAVNPMSILAYNEPFKVLEVRHKPIQPISFFQKVPYLICSLIEYVLAAVALYNIADVAVKLTRRAIVGNDCNRDYQVTVWALWALALHVVGVFILRWRVRIDRSLPARRPVWPFFRSILIDEITPCAEQSGAFISMQQETHKFLFLAWANSIATVVHIAYGSQFFAQMLFLSGGEGMQVLCRCMASVVLCRLILMYELHGMAKTVSVLALEDEHTILAQHGSVQITKGDPNASDIALLHTAHRMIDSDELA